ncbi:MAG TPA: histidine phosphatase family protein, partial [Candidatus Saccharimonadia bacterium]|nr:histidine phosphatase family protein [Candidatus Saccharimonadia bacterium]
MIYFARHGQTQANIDKICAGRTYPAPLTETGHYQAQAEGERLKASHLQIDRIICSPMERAQDTARIIAVAIGFKPTDIQIDDRLNEYDMGSLAGQSENDVQPEE